MGPQAQTGVKEQLAPKNIIDDPIDPIQFSVGKLEFLIFIKTNGYQPHINIKIHKGFFCIINIL